MQIKYQREKTFNDLISPYSHRLLRFDFYLPDYNCCIECQGDQHQLNYKPHGYITTQTLERLHFCDNIKKKYCNDNNIKLLTIPYEDYSKITEHYVRYLLGEIG